MKKRGRKHVPAEQKRSQRLTVVVSVSEHDRVCQLAYSLRMDVSRFIRLMLMLETDPLNFGRH